MGEISCREYRAVLKNLSFICSPGEVWKASSTSGKGACPSNISLGVELHNKSFIDIEISTYHDLVLRGMDIIEMV